MSVKNIQKKKKLQRRKCNLIFLLTFFFLEEIQAYSVIAFKFLRLCLTEIIVNDMLSGDF